MSANLVRDLRALFARLRLPSLRKADLRAIAPGIIALAFAPFLVPLVRLELNEPLFGDQVVYQYMGWCLRHGLKLYRDMGMADGPFIYFVHAAMQVFAGITDRGFRKWDLVVQIAGSGAMGVLLAPTAGLGRGARHAARAAWGATSAALWLSWYLSLEWSITCQRDIYYSLVGSLGMVALYASARYRSRFAVAAAGIGAFLTTTQLFGKPTGLAYMALGALAVLLPDASATVSRRVRWRAALIGAGVAFLAVVLLLLLFGSLRGYFLWCVRIPYRGNKFLFHIDWLRLLLKDWQPARMMAVVSLVAGVTAIACDWLPLRSLGFVLAPSLLFLGACLQARGFEYQVTPVGAAVHVLGLVALSSVWDPGEPRESTHGWSDSRALVAGLAFSFAGYYGFGDIQGSPYRWNGDETKWNTPQHTFAVDEKKVGDYLRAHTKPDDEVFAYSAGENAHFVLLTGERRTASPFFHSFWLDPVGLLPQSELQPNPAELAALTALQTDIRGIACQAVDRNTPAAMVFNQLPQVFKVCPEIEAMLRDDYRDATSIGAFHVYLRKR